MPCTGKPCHNCGKSDKPVYERYQCVAGTSMEFRAAKIGDKLYRIEPKNMEYWCTNCFRLENGSVEYV
jgi:hypothetical protein